MLLTRNGLNGVAGDALMVREFQYSLPTSLWAPTASPPSRIAGSNAEISTSPKEKDLSPSCNSVWRINQMVDNVGQPRRKGFIAQELEKVLPGAVLAERERHPDIFAFATNATYVPRRNLVLGLTKPHELKVGDQVRSRWITAPST